MKCGHTNPQASGLETEACPSCGAIYSRVEAAIAAGKLRSPAKPPAPVQISPTAAAPSEPSLVRPVQPHTGAFIKILREGSHYPTLREVVKILTFLSYFIWGLGGLLGGFAALTKGQLMAAIGIVVFSMLMLVMTKVFKEVSLMVADLSDAAVMTAEKLSQTAQS